MQYLLYTVAVVNFLLSLIVIANAPSSRVNRYFGFFALLGSFWSLGTALLLYTPGQAAVTVGQFLFFAAPLGTSYFILLFSMVFPYSKHLSTLRKGALAVYPLLLGIIYLGNSDFFITSTVAAPVNQVAVSPYGYSLYAAFFFVYLGVAPAYLLRVYMNKTLHFALRSQTIYATVAISLTSVVSAFTNLIIPILGDTTYIWAGPLTGLPFMFLISRAIIRHKLFNIRVVVARTLGYAFSFLVLAAGYFSISHFISSELRARFEGQSAEALLSLLLLIGTVLLFQPLKSRFDRLTNKIFYQDAYDPQEFLSELNKLLVETVDIESLLVGSSEIIKRNIKAEYCSFVIRETSYFEQRTIGAESKKFSAESTKIIRETMPSMHRKIVVTDELDEGNAELAEVLREHDIAVVVRLVTTLEYDVGGLGYMLLGVKKSGNPYTSQDMHVLEIIGNELVISAQNALRFEEIENFNITLQNKVDDATKRLRQTNEKLKKMDETKDEFISMASHQLRTPLTSVKGYISMVMEGDAGKINDQQHKLLDQAFISSQRMVFLIADLLNVSRLKTGKFVIEPKRINLADVIEGEVRQLQETAVSRKLELVYDKPENFPDLMLDDTKIRQVIMNFIDNAIYYTPFDGRIDVELKEKPQTIEFTVSDNGIGVPKSEQHKLFGKFYRAGNARKARPDGTGLGLFMAKKIIIAQGGTIIFKSTEGKGSVFGFTFPKDKLEVAGQIEVTDDGEDDS